MAYLFTFPLRETYLIRNNIPSAYFECDEKLRSKRFFINHERHLGRIGAVVPFQHVDDTLGTATGHSFIRIGGETRNLAGAGEMGEETTTIFDSRIAERRVGRKRLALEDVERGAGNPALFQRASESGFVDDGTARGVDEEGRR